MRDLYERNKQYASMSRKLKHICVAAKIMNIIGIDSLTEFDHKFGNNVHPSITNISENSYFRFI